MTQMSRLRERERLEAAYDACRVMQRRKDPTFWLATARLPAEMRPPVHALYGFVRTADELVDGCERSLTRAERLAGLDRLERELLAARDGAEAHTPAVIALADAGRRHDLPLDELGPYLDSMRRDVDPLRIKSWADLESYMEGSAGSVGRIMAPLLGAPGSAHWSFARLGLAFQLTNFIRDIDEDLELGRVYLPADELVEAGTSPDMLMSGTPGDGLGAVVERQVVRARQLFDEGQDGARSVSPAVRRGISFARAIYLRTLDRVENLGFQVIGRRTSLPPFGLAAAAMDGLRGRA